MSLSFTSRLVARILKSDVTVSKPSRVSKVRVLRGLSRRVTTRVRRVEDWMAGQLEGSRRSRRSWRLVGQSVWLWVGDRWGLGLGWGMEEGNVRSCIFLGRRGSGMVGAGGVFLELGRGSKL